MQSTVRTVVKSWVNKKGLEMPRTTATICAHGQIDTPRVLEIWKSIIEGAGFQQKLIKGEPCWSKGDGVLMLQRNFTIAFGEREIVLEGWMGDALLGESDLTGVNGWMQKKKMKGLLSQAEGAIRSIV